MDAKEFQENFPDIAEGVNAMISSQSSSLRANEERLGRLEAVSQNEFLRRVDAACPGWRDLSQDPDWATFLGQKDRYSRRHLDLLNAALQGFDADPVINLVNDFRRTKQGTPTPAAQPRTPGQAGGVTRAFITRFYQDVVHGKYRFREKEKEAIQKKIDEAVASGSVA